MAAWKAGTLEPALAQSSQANADATVWTFKMRPGTKWSDGKPLTAKDFEYAWRRVVDPKTASIYTASLASVKNALDVIKGAMPPEQLDAKKKFDEELKAKKAAVAAVTSKARSEVRTGLQQRAADYLAAAALLPAGATLAVAGSAAIEPKLDAGYLLTCRKSLAQLPEHPLYATPL